MYHVVIHGQEVRAEYHRAVTATAPRLHVDRETLVLAAFPAGASAARGIVNLEQPAAFNAALTTFLDVLPV